MTSTVISPSPTEELWEVDFDKSIDCEFRIPPEMDLCGKAAVCRVKIHCDRPTCDLHEIAWTCDEHFDFLRSGKIYCSICSLPCTGWEIVS